MYRRICVVLAVLFLFPACSDPETSAQEAVARLSTEWTQSQESLDPIKRLKSYQTILDELNAIAVDYKETQVGGALAAGRSAGGLSAATIKGEVDRLAPRAECYAAPTVDCLSPFGTRSNQGVAGEGGVQDAVRLVCEEGFERADRALENLKINRPVYAENLVQVALHAAQCKRPDDVRAAIVAYQLAEPKTGSARIDQFMTILNTPQLKPAWPGILAEVEKAAPGAGFAPGRAAGIDLALAQKYAVLGDAQTAVAKYTHVTTTLGFSTDLNTRRELASALIASGHPDAGMSIVSNERVQSIPVHAVYGAAGDLGRQLGIISFGPGAQPNTPANDDLTAFFEPASPEQARTIAPIADQIEVLVDAQIATLPASAEWAGGGSPSTTLGVLALVQQKLGNADKANSLLQKGEAAREKMLPPGAYKPDGESYLAEYELLVALGQGNTDRAAELSSRVRKNYNQSILMEVARRGEAEKALTLMSQFNSAHPNTYQMIIAELGSHGFTREAEQVLNAFPGNASLKATLAWGLVENAAKNGDLEAAESIAAQYDLLGNSGYRIRLSELKAERAIAQGDRGDAEAAIRQMFTLGEEVDRTAAQNRARDAANAQNAAKLAFSAGYADLGIELYRAATTKDQRPFFAAFSGKMKSSDYPEVLMLAHDSLRGENLGYVIDSAVRALKK